MKKSIVAILIFMLLCCAAIAETEIPGLKYERTMENTYAEQFVVEYYEGGYKLLTIGNGNRYLIVPENDDAPRGLADDIRVIQQPLHDVYLAATSAMSLFDALDALDVISLSSQAAESWYVENAVKAMNEGRIVYAGKYSEPDYELLLQKNCTLSIQNTMILHTPKVQEMIELLGIPVFVDYSSYESHPLGRTEWVKLYGAMVNKETEAEDFFEKQAMVVEKLKDFPNTGLKVAFFATSDSGKITIRAAEDYIPKMIEIAGGEYAFKNFTDEGDSRSSVTITMEQFYDTAVDADYLIYNATIESPLNTIDDLIEKDSLFADFKAVREGNVWSTDRQLYQATDIVGQLILDVNHMLIGEDDHMTFLRKLS